LWIDYLQIIADALDQQVNEAHGIARAGGATENSQKLRELGLAVLECERVHQLAVAELRAYNTELSRCIKKHGNGKIKRALQVCAVPAGGVPPLVYDEELICIHAEYTFYFDGQKKSSAVEMELVAAIRAKKDELQSMIKDNWGDEGPFSGFSVWSAKSITVAPSLAMIAPKSCCPLTGKRSRQYSHHKSSPTSTDK
jgi:hypothetical protein